MKGKTVNQILRSINIVKMKQEKWNFINGETFPKKKRIKGPYNYYHSHYFTLNMYMMKIEKTMNKGREKKKCLCQAFIHSRTLENHALVKALSNL